MTAWLGPYAGFIAGSYGAVALVVALLVGWVVIDHRRQRRLLRDLDASGIVRRSGRKATEI